jgi:hypothetical protein
MAADQLEYFYRTADATALHAARRELRGAVAMWERLVKLTDGAFPEEMAFGPDDNGHWKHRLPYVQHDLKRIDDRFAILEKFGRFDFGFDFGGPVAQRRGGAYRNDPYVLGHSIEPRFKGVDPATTYSEELGYGWVTNAERHAVPLKPTPFHEIRAAVKEPRSLPENALFGDSIRGMGAQLFRVRTGEGEFEVDVLGVGKRQIHAMNGVVDITMPESAWNVQGIVIRRAGAAHHEVPLQRWPVSLPSPEIVHAPPSHAASGKPLTLSVRVSAARGIVRLHYRPLNQLAKFATAEQPAARATFVIPAHEIPSDYDLMYYFEVLDRGQGWFHPDPVVTTPYYVIQTLPAGSPTSTAASR